MTIRARGRETHQAVQTLWRANENICCLTGWKCGWVISTAEIADLKACTPQAGSKLPFNLPRQQAIGRDVDGPAAGIPHQGGNDAELG